MMSIKYLKRYMKLKKVSQSITSITYNILEDGFTTPLGIITVPFKVSEQQLFDWLLDAYRYCQTIEQRANRTEGNTFNKFLRLLTEVKDEVLDIREIHPRFAMKAVEFLKLGYSKLGKGWYRHIYKHGSFYFNNIEFDFEVMVELKVLEGIRQIGIVVWSNATTYEKGVVYPCNNIKSEAVLKRLQEVFGKDIEVFGLSSSEDSINDEYQVEYLDW